MALVKCEECGQMVSDMADVCPKCGAPIERKVKCAECGHEMRATDKACPTCGCPNPQSNGSFEGSSAVGVSMPKEQHIVFTGTDYYSNTGQSRKSRFTFFLLAIIGWPLGLHYFYVGKTGVGILNIVCTLLSFLVIPLIIIFVLSIFAGYKALVMRQEDFENEFVFTNSSYPI